MVLIGSETGRLRSVMVHLPGDEIDRMLPSMMNELLFDDILFGDRAREEHRRFQSLLEYVADEVIDVQDLLLEILEDPGVRDAILADLTAKLSLPPATTELLAAAAADDLAGYLVAGIVRRDVSQLPANPSEVYQLPPVPNLCFQRDPAVVIGDRVAISSMATAARLREPLLVGYVFRHHPRFAGVESLYEPFDADLSAHRRPTIEGGDVIVAREDLLLIGLSERTGRHSVEALAAGLKKAKSPVQKIILVDLPRERSFMHLDTVFTIINRDECLIYEPAILPGEVAEVDVYQVDLAQREVSYTAKRSLLNALKSNGLDLRPIPCGGPNDPISQQREQWTDGANAFALAPGVILGYKRNVRTAEELERVGYEIVYDDDILLGRTALDLEDGDRKYAIQLDSHELSRARGGPRCMTMPLERALLDG